MAMNSFKKMIMMANQIDDKPSLPSHIVRCEYLECTGTQYIDLGYPLGYNNKVVIDVEPNNVTTESILIGNNTISSRAFAIGTKNVKSANLRFDGRTIQCNLYKEGRYFISMDKNGASAREDVYTWNPASFVTEGNVFLFAWRGASGTAQYFYKGKIYSCQIYENDILIHDYIPAFNVNLSRAGMYDLVTGIFLTNNGTGEFVFETPNIPDTILEERD